MTTTFNVGEKAGKDNDNIPNKASFWDDDWQKHFGGVDTLNRKFTPQENPFYFALPYGEYDTEGNLKKNVANVPWYKKDKTIKNRWIEVTYKGKTCYGQWEDVGPIEEDDFAYVFGSAKPKNKFDTKAGLDISPTMFHYLGMKDNDITTWRFVDFADVPDGPWKTTITTRGISWR